jgi:hypothetical protein
MRAPRPARARHEAAGPPDATPTRLAFGERHPHSAGRVRTMRTANKMHEVFASFLRL